MAWQTSAHYLRRASYALPAPYAASLPRRGAASPHTRVSRAAAAAIANDIGMAKIIGNIMKKIV